MPLEVEIKLRVADHQPTREALKSAGAKFIRRELEINTFLDTAGQTLLNAGSGLRVRKAQDLDSQASRVVITHKGPRRTGAMKIREETELRCQSYDEALCLLGALGYEVKLSFEKRRETWELGECEVVLDELPGELGRFVEVEGPDEATVQGVRQQLGLDDAPVEPEGYAVLVSAHLREAGQTTLRF